VPARQTSTHFGLLVVDCNVVRPMVGCMSLYLVGVPVVGSLLFGAGFEAVFAPLLVGWLC
jgi:hypothetical protein